MEPTNRIDGTAIARDIERRVSLSGSSLTQELVGIVATDDAAGLSFQHAKQKAAQRSGIRYRIEELRPDITQQDALDLVLRTVSEPSCGGIVLQLPLPSQLDTQALLDAVPAEQDPDVLGAAAYAVFLTDGTVVPPAAGTVAEILDRQGFALSDGPVAVVGQGRLVGLPVADWLDRRGASVQRLDIGFDEATLREAKLVVLGTGAYRLDPRLLAPGTGVIDFGYRDGQGDLDTEDPAALEHLAFYTPTPGGTGPVLVAKLMENFSRLYQE